MSANYNKLNNYIKYTLLDTANISSSAASVLFFTSSVNKITFIL